MNPSIEAALLALKEKALEATRQGDSEFYRHYLAEGAIAVGPFGILDKEGIVAQMASGSTRFRSSKIEDTRVMALSSQSGLVTYKATFETSNEGGAKVSSMFVTTVYAQIDGVWQGVFYQQTPLQK
ncbi:nuclear transport factor 2 family protein [Paenibacillus rigui]|nr:nuclear transport factor 2 family protein [Paenibacillus rigui]